MSTSSEAERHVVIGAVERPHGLGGEVRVRATGPTLPGLSIPVRVRLGPPVDGALTIVSLRGDAPRMLARFEGVEDRDAAARLSGAAIEVAEIALPRLGEDEFYVRDLIGLEVRVDDLPVGRVVDLLDMPANDVIVVDLDDGEQVLVPFISDAVASVAREAGVLHVEAWVLERR